MSMNARRENSQYLMPDILRNKSLSRSPKKQLYVYIIMDLVENPSVVIKIGVTCDVSEVLYHGHHERNDEQANYDV